MHNTRLKDDIIDLKITISGKSNIGKSTLARYIKQMLAPAANKITIGDAPDDSNDAVKLKKLHNIFNIIANRNIYIECVGTNKLFPNLETDNATDINKIVERRIVTQDWYESETSKTGWDSYGWRFDDGTSYLGHRENWEIVEHIKSDKFGNPTIGIAEKETIL